jgi:putative spermidine/putrescine transport system permease protein
VTLSRGARIALLAFLVVALTGVYVPLALVILNSFNADQTFSWPPPGFTLDWWSRALDNQGARSALLTSLKAATAATAIALVLGTMAAFAVGRYRFFGRTSISFVILLPIALPGIVTGIALNATFSQVLGPLGISFGLFTIIVGHATFCIVVVFNNVLARLRRTGGSLDEASSDLGATTLQTFRYVTFPQVRTSLLAGALLAFGLSFDEIIVTTFTAGAGVQTLPLWILDNLARPNQAPVVNVVAAVVLVLSIIPIYLSQRVAGDSAAGGRV